MKTHWKKLNNPDYLGAYSLDDNPTITVTIDKVIREMVNGMDGKKEELTVAHMKSGKPMIINPTNAKRITKLYDTPFIEDWAGKQIILCVERIKAFGEQIDALRVKNQLPQLPELKPGHPKWDGAIKAIKDGTVTIDQVKVSFRISQANEKILCQK